MLLNKTTLVGLRGLTLALVVAAALPSLGASSCGGDGADAGSGSSTSSGSVSVGGASASGASAASGTSSIVNAVQIITKGDPTGSFDLVSVPAAGGALVTASRFYNLDGSTITTANVPPWFAGAHVFLTSTRTSTGPPNPVANGLQDTPCAYFDTEVDANPDSTGFYTIDGYNTTFAPNDIDQCAGTAANELSQVGLNIVIDRTYMNPTDKLELIVKAELIDQPTTAPTPSTCISNGFFDPTVCSNQTYTVTMRTAPGAAAKPFFLLFPSASALDLLSQSVLLPINGNQSITTISIDRVKGGSVFYGMTVLRLL